MKNLIHVRKIVLNIIKTKIEFKKYEEDRESSEIGQVTFYFEFIYNVLPRSEEYGNKIGKINNI